MHQNWMRDYDPATGRYLQADPLGLVDGASVYGYALQNPLHFGDVTGEAVFSMAFQIDAYGFGGGSFSIGRYWEWGCECGEGVETVQFKTIRFGAGFGLSVSMVVSFMPYGCKEDFFGDSTSTEISGGPVSVEDGKSSSGVAYGSGGVGLGLPYGLSVGNNATTEIRF